MHLCLECFAKATNLALKTAKAAFATNSTSGYESDGNAESALLRSLAGPDGDEAGDEDHHPQAEYGGGLGLKQHRVRCCFSVFVVVFTRT